MMTRCFCDPALTTFGKLDIGDVFQYIGGSAEFTKKEKHHATLYSHPCDSFFEVPNKQVIRVGYYLREPKKSDAALPCTAATSNQGAQG